MNRICLMITFAAVVAMTTETLADEAGGKQRPERGDRAGQARQQRPAGGARGGQTDRNPEQMVAKMMESFDKDGDQKLDLSELTAMMTSMRERRSQGMQGRQGSPNAQGRGAQGRGGQRPGGAGNRPDGENGQPRAQRRKGGRPGGADAKPGGERPRRPGADQEKE